MRARMERSRRAVGRYPREGGSVEIWRETRAGENGGERRAFGRPAAREDARETASGDDARCERPAARRTEVFEQLAPEPARADDEDVHHVVEHGFDVLAGLEPRARDGPPAKEETVDVGPSPGKVAAVVHGVRHHRHPGGAARAKRGRVRARESTRGSKTVSGARGHRDDRTSTTHRRRRTKQQLGPLFSRFERRARAHAARAARRARGTFAMSSEVSDARDIRAARRPRLGLSERSRAARRETLAAVADLDAFVLDRATRAADVAALARATLADVVRAPRPVADTTSATVPDPKPATGPRPPPRRFRARRRNRAPSMPASVSFPRTRPTTSATSSSSARSAPLDARIPPRRVPRPRPRPDPLPGRTPARRTPPRPLPPQTPRGAAWARDAGLTPPRRPRVPARATTSTPERDRTRATRLAAAPSPLGLGRGAHGAAVARRAPLRPRAHRRGPGRGEETRDAAAAAAAAAAASAATGKTDASPPRVSAGASRSAASPSRGVVSEGLGPSEGFHHLRDPSDLSDEHRVERTLAAVGERLERTPGAIPEGTSSDAVVRRLKAHAAATAAAAAMAAGVRKRVASVRGINDAVGSSPSSAGPSSASDSDSDSEPSAPSSSSDSDVSSDGSGSDDERSRASAAPPSRPGVLFPSETETSPKQHRRPPPPIENENADAAASDDDVLMDLRRLRARLRREPVSRSPRGGVARGGAWRGRSFRWNRRRRRASRPSRGATRRATTSLAARRPSRTGARGETVASRRGSDGGAGWRWRGRRLRARARALRVRFGGGAHYHLGDGAFANGGAWDVVETEGVAGVADRFRAWRRKAFGFVRWREWAAFDAPVAAEAKATEEALRRSEGRRRSKDSPTRDRATERRRRRRRRGGGGESARRGGSPGARGRWGRARKPRIQTTPREGRANADGRSSPFRGIFIQRSGGGRVADSSPSLRPS